MRVETKTLYFPEMLSEKQFELLAELVDDLNPFKGIDEELLLSRFSQEDIEKNKRNSYLLAFYLFVGSSHFVHHSPVAVDIAKALNTTVENVRILAETPEWEKAVRYWGWKGSIQLQNKREKGRVPFPLQEVYLLTQAFQKECDVRLVTYAGIIDARVKDVFKYDIVLEDNTKIKKHDLILAFPKDRMPYLKEGIKRRKSIADLDLKAITHPSEKPKLDAVAQLGSLVECIMRNGLVVVGENVWISKYNIVLRVGGRKGHRGKIILIYKHALHEFRVLKQGQKRDSDYSDDWDDEDEN
ncbi:MAG: hypothetical protein OXH00_21675 [Candidatus Poribacteria bacterium]|nr:hypothetical protein [Candidatus Poribacteria bacterium]